MSLKNQKRLAASLLGGGLNRVWIDPEENDRVQSGRRKKAGSRKGSQKPGKEAWVLKIRAIRRHLRWLRDKRQLSPGSYATLLGMAKGGAFRSGSHVDEYVKARQLLKKR